VVSIFTELKETELGLAYISKGRAYTLSKIIDEFAGFHCPQLVGKPKIFFFFDQGIKKDGGYDKKAEVIITTIRL
jgi:hypothetical protein